MSDLVERLRSVSGCTQKTFMHRLDWEDGKQIIGEAASEIERLQGEVRHLRIDNARLRDEAFARSSRLPSEHRGTE